MPCPKLLESVLGVGVAQASCHYNQTFLGCGDKLKNRPDTQVFNIWKSKLKKHEDRQQTVASQHWRHEKRTLAKQKFKNNREREGEAVAKSQNLTTGFGTSAFANPQAVVSRTQYQQK